MVKKTIKIYLEENDLKLLKEKTGTSRGSISHYIQKIAREPVCFLDENAKVLLKALDLK